MGWEALEQWGDDVARIEPFAGGVANQVWSVRVNGQLAVGRLGARFEITEPSSALLDPCERHDSEGRDKSPLQRNPDNDLRP
jgi:hypothetical protein